MKKSVYTFFVLLITLTINAQTFTEFEITLNKKVIQDFPKVQSYAFASTGDKWLIIGGKTTGLHGFRPPDAFPLQDFNTKIYVLDIVTEKVYSIDNSKLPTSIAEQLSSTNMLFKQYDGKLYIIGGYGYSTSSQAYKTYPSLTVVDIKGCIQAIIQNKDISPYFKQITDQRMAVTGGGLKVMDGTFYMVGGHKFDGRYNPHGNQSYTQTYTNEIRKFKITDNGTTISISAYKAIKDEDHLHRRDYNLVPQVFHNGKPGLTAFSGVFQKHADLPFFNCVDINPDTFIVRNDAIQYLNQYHTANLPLYDSINNTMHTIFFGGIGMFTWDTLLNKFEADSAVPFVNTISRMTRHSDNSVKEYVMKNEMPALLGSGAEFIIHPDIETYENGVLKLDKIGNSKTLVGYIYGGIESSQPNIFMQSTGSSDAINHIYKVYLTKKVANAMENQHLYFQTKVYPNPTSSTLNIQLTTLHSGNIKIEILDINGKTIGLVRDLKQTPASSLNIQTDVSSFSKGKYFLKISLDNKSKLINFTLQ